MYPPREDGGRWREVWYEDGERKQCESVSEAKLAGKLDKVQQQIAAVIKLRKHGPTVRKARWTKGFRRGEGWF